MSVISISRGSWELGREVAEKVAQKLGYGCVSRDILLQASRQFNIPEIELSRAINDAPSILERFTYGKEKYIAYIKAALLQRVVQDNIVYHGLAAPFFLKGIPHVLKIHITADLEDEIKEEMARQNIPYDKARTMLVKDHEERRKWSLHLYGIDTLDSRIYDMVLHLKTISADDAAAIIADTVQLPCFHTTSASQAIVNDLLLAAQVEAALLEAALSKDLPSFDISVTAKDGVVTVSIKAFVVDSKEVIKRIENIVKKIGGTKDVKVNIMTLIGAS